MTSIVTLFSFALSSPGYFNWEIFLPNSSSVTNFAFPEKTELLYSILTSGFVKAFETLLLSRPPVRTGIPVVDIDGHKIGKVKLLHRHPDIRELKSIEVSYGLIHSKILPKSEIWGVGEKIILRMTKEEFKNFE